MEQFDSFAVKVYDFLKIGKYGISIKLGEPTSDKDISAKVYFNRRGMLAMKLLVFIVYVKCELNIITEKIRSYYAAVRKY